MKIPCGKRLAVVVLAVFLACGCRKASAPATEPAKAQVVEPGPQAADGGGSAPGQADTASTTAGAPGEQQRQPSTQTVRPQGTPPARRQPQSAPAPAAQPPRITGVFVTPQSFNPSVGQVVTIGYHLSAAAEVTINIYGPNRELVRQFLTKVPKEAGHHREIWTGEDDEGAVVANEAYFFVIEATAGGKTACYDPLTFSGGELVTAQDFHFRPKENSISYVLPKACRVRLRAGLDHGPMLNTMVNWEPRVSGVCTEVWRGRDRQGLRHFSTRPGCFVISMAYALPENSIIAVGNRDRDYRRDYLAAGHKRPRKPDVPRSPGKPGVISPHWERPPHLNRDPEIAVTFPELEKQAAAVPPGTQPAPGKPAVPRLTGDSTILRVSIPDEADLAFMDEQKFEMVLFVDDNRILEAEQSHAPFNWTWDLTDLKPGKHYVTVNLVSATDHVGVFTAPVEVGERQANAPSAPPVPEPWPTTPKE